MPNIDRIECPDCEGKGNDSGALYEPEACGLCLGTGSLAPEEFDDTCFYDYARQVWVNDGVFMSCGHPDSGCGCFGRLHAGELYTDVAPRKPMGKAPLYNAGERLSKLWRNGQ